MMTDKARNIYIDTTGFCDEAKRRVDNAFSRMRGASYSLSATYEDDPVKAIDNDGYLLSREAPEHLVFFQREGWRKVWLFELESLAGIR